MEALRKQIAFKFHLSQTLQANMAIISIPLLFRSLPICIAVKCKAREEQWHFNSAQEKDLILVGVGETSLRIPSDSLEGGIGGCCQIISLLDGLFIHLFVHTFSALCIIWFSRRLLT